MERNEQDKYKIETRLATLSNSIRHMRSYQRRYCHLINKSIADDMKNKGSCRRKGGGQVKTPGAVNLMIFIIWKSS